MNRTAPRAAARLVFATAIVAALTAFCVIAGPDSPYFAVSASLCVLGLIDLGCPLVRPKLPRVLWRIRGWESKGVVFRVLGVRTFGAVLRRTPARLLNRRVYLASKRSRAEVLAEIESAEAAHLWGTLVTLPYIVFGSLQGWWSAVISLLVFDVLVNVYPAMHLRFVRARLSRIARSGPAAPHRSRGD